MTELYTEIEINAPAETVWRLLMDFEKYPDWNPFIRSIKGKAKEGERLEAFIQPSGKKGMLFKPVVVSLKTNEHFGWLGRLFIKGLFDGKHEFLLDPPETARKII